MMDMTWQQVETRLQRLEAQMEAITSRLKPTADPEIEYIIFVDNQEVWTGGDIDKQLPTIFKHYPHRQIHIDWRSVPFNWV